MSRAVVTAVFVLLTTLVGAAAIDAWANAAADGGLHGLSLAAYATLKLGVVLAFTFFVVVRDPARRPSRDPVAFAACGVAVAAVVALGRPADSASTFLVVGGDLVTLAFGVWLLASVLALGRCFGVLPEARGLITSGPYAVVRHPVYLGELGAAGGLVLAAPSARNVGVLAAFAAAQAVRMRLEERALASEFADYAGYAARTPRLFPRLALPGAGRSHASAGSPREARHLDNALARIAVPASKPEPTTFPEGSL